MAVVAVGGQKGGTGKTTTAISVAAELVARHREVLLVDADGQTRTASRWRTLAGAHPEHRAPTTLVSVGAGLLDDVRHQARNFEFTIIDLPPELDVEQRLALIVSDLILLPCGQSAAEAWALSEAMRLVHEAWDNGARVRAAALLTRIDARTSLGRGARLVLERSGIEVMKTTLHYRVAYQEAIAAGLGPAQYAPRDAAADEVHALVDELEALAADAEHPPKTVAHRSAASR